MQGHTPHAKDPVNSALVLSLDGLTEPQGPAAPNEPNIIKNKILAYCRQAAKAVIAINFPYPHGVPSQSTVKNNIFAFARLSILSAYDPYSFTSVPPSPLFFVATNNIFCRP
jgi:hypothetical protein